jgi:hypothetical protein
MCEDAMWQLFRWGIRFISRAAGGAMSGGIWGEGGYVRERGLMEKTRREVIQYVRCREIISNSRRKGDMSSLQTDTRNCVWGGSDQWQRRWLLPYNIISNHTHRRLTKKTTCGLSFWTYFRFWSRGICGWYLLYMRRIHSTGNTGCGGYQGCHMTNYNTAGCTLHCKKAAQNSDVDNGGANQTTWGS